MAEVEKRGRVVVAGATGYLGRHVVCALHEAGWNVRALVRDASRLQAAADCCDEVFVGEATRPETLDGLFDDADAVFSSLGIRHGRSPTYREVDYRANLNLVEAAEAAAVRRFVFISVVDADRGRRLSPLVDARERVVERLKRSTMEAVVVRPTAFFNDMSETFEMARKGKVWLIGGGETRVNPIHGADLAKVVRRALEEVASGAEISAGGPDTFTQREIGELAFSALGKTPRFGRVSGALLRALATLAKPFHRNASALMMMFSQLADHDALGTPSGERKLATFFDELASDRTFHPRQ